MPAPKFISDEEIASGVHKLEDPNPQFISDDEINSGKHQITDPPSYLSSALGGALQGASLGTSDEIVGAVRGGIGKLTGEGDYSELYPKYRDEERTRLKALENANPKTYGGAELAGGLAPAFVPGLQGEAAVGLGRMAIAGAASGAVQGLGYSEKKDESGLASDALTGAALGAAPTGLIKAGGVLARKIAQTAPAQALKEGAEFLAEKAAPKIKDFAINSLANITSSDDAILKKYIANRAAVNDARAVDEIGHDVTANVDKLKDMLVNQSRKATDLIPDTFQVPKEAIAYKINELRQSFNNSFTDTAEKAGVALKRIQDRLKTSSHENMSGRDIKKFIKDLDAEISYGEKAGEFMTPEHTSKLEFRRYLDGLIKDSSPEYKAAMVNVAKKAQALSDAQTHFGRTDATISRLKAIGNRPQDRPEVVQALANMDRELGTNLSKENEMRKIQEYLREDLSGGRGPRNRLIGGAVGGMVGSSLGLAGTAGGAAAGAKIGQKLDKEGRQLAKYVIDKAMSPSKIRPYVQNQSQRAAELLRRNPSLAGSENFIIWKNLDKKKKMSGSGSEEN
jgi:hypothetical protein